MALSDAVTAFPVCGDGNAPLAAQKLQNAATFVITVFLQDSVKLLRGQLIAVEHLVPDQLGYFGSGQITHVNDPPRKKMRKRRAVQASIQGGVYLH